MEGASTKPSSGSADAAVAEGVTPTTAASGDADASISSEPLSSPLGDVFREGELVGGRFEVQKLLGRGGMGEVYTVLDHELGQLVALKTLRSGRAALPTAVLKREVQVARRVTHPCACRVFEFGVHVTSRDAVPFLVMEYLEGATLADHVKRHGPLGGAALLSLARDLAGALAAAHAVNVVHRDLKPSNVMLVPTGHGLGLRGVVTDFGVARMTEELAEGGGVPMPSPAATTAFAGTPAYMAPEQLRGRGALPSTDVYAFGLTLYEAATGRTPPFAQSLAGLLAERSDPASARKLAAASPADLAAVLERCLAPDPAARYQNGRALEEALAKLGLDGRRERWGKRVVRGVVLGSALVAAASLFGADRARRTATLDGEATRRFGQEAAELEAVIRHVAMAPLHDVRREHAAVERRLRALEAELPTLRPAPAAAARRALLRGHLALGHVDEAERQARALWDAGDHAPDVRFLRARVLAERYRWEHAKLPVVTDPTFRARRQAELDVELRKPAVELLASVPAEGTDVPELTLAMIAAYQGQRERLHDAALRVLARSPWMYEAPRLEAELLLEEADRARADGDQVRAEALLHEAEAPLQRAVDAAASDGPTQLAACAFATHLERVRIQRTAGTAAGAARGVAACERALRVNPEDPKALIALSEALLLASHPEPRRPRFDRALLVARRAVELAPSDGFAHAALADAFANLVILDFEEGLDPRANDDAAADAFERAAELAPDSILYTDRAIAATDRAQYDTRVGGDPRPALARMTAVAERALARVPDSYALHELLGRAALHVGLYEGAHDQLPIASYESALAHFEWMADHAQDDPTGPLHTCFTATHLAYFLRKIGERPHAAVARAERGCRAAMRQNPNIAHTVLGDVYLALVRYQRDVGEPVTYLEPARRELALARESVTTDPEADANDTREKLVGLETTTLDGVAPRDPDGPAAFQRGLAMMDRPFGALPPARLPHERVQLHRAWVEWLARSGRDVAAAATTGLAVGEEALRERPYSPNVHIAQARMHLAWARTAARASVRREHAAEAVRLFETSLREDKHARRIVETRLAQARELRDAGEPSEPRR